MQRLSDNNIYTKVLAGSPVLQKIPFWIPREWHACITISAIVRHTIPRQFRFQARLEQSHPTHLPNKNRQKPISSCFHFHLAVARQYMSSPSAYQTKKLLRRVYYIWLASCVSTLRLLFVWRLRNTLCPTAMPAYQINFEFTLDRFTQFYYRDGVDANWRLRFGLHICLLNCCFL